MAASGSEIDKNAIHDVEADLLFDLLERCMPSSIDKHLAIAINVAISSIITATNSCMHGPAYLCFSTSDLGDYWGEPERAPH